MSEVPTNGQIRLLVAAAGLFVVAGALSLSRLWGETESRRIAAKICFYAGMVLAAVVLSWHSFMRRRWMPLENNFDALLWLGLLLALFLAYTQRVRPLRGLDWFVIPIIVWFLVTAAVFGRAKPHEYVSSTWSRVHQVTAYAGALALSIAGAVGAMYLIANQRLRHKRTAPLGSLERLEHFTRVSVALGFPLLTLGLITGLVRALNSPHGNDLGPEWYRSPKVLLAFGAWAVYALVLHAPINPSFRGRRAAMLSVVGFVLMIGVIVAVQYMPARR
jgi:ABC-type transport system involved in cytochrome c biogenesis permease subunit